MSNKFLHPTLPCLCALALSIAWTNLGFAQKFKSIGEDQEVRTVTLKLRKPVTLSWILPASSSPAYEKNTTFSISVRLESPYKPRENDFVVYVDGKVYAGKLDQASLSTKNNTVLFTREIEQPPGKKETKVEVVYTAPNGEPYRPPAMLVQHDFSLKKATLRMLFVGVSDYNADSELPDLRFAEKDAETIFHIFRNQNGLFGKIDSTLLIGPRASSGNLIAAVNAIRQLSQDGEVKPEDVLILYISSHGTLLDDGDFRIATFDYRALAKERTTVSMRREVLYPLREVNCKKIIFLDACFSGKASSGGKTGEGDLSKAIADILNAAPGFTTIASSSATQQSWELDRYGHGSFSQAMIEALSEKANRNDDDIINLDEVFAYVAKRVPELNKAEGKPEQTPTRTDNELGGMPIFAIPKKKND
ncbi:MAG: caspase family protein [Saprospiraceae bacterium]|nr:caspase family protein [Saprospiraceae bacterium]